VADVSTTAGWLGWLFHSGRYWRITTWLTAGMTAYQPRYMMTLYKCAHVCTSVCTVGVHCCQSVVQNPGGNI